MAAFEVYDQPLVNLDTGKISRCEARLRWRHPERGTISPAEFVPLAEETGLSNEPGKLGARHGMRRGRDLAG
jgi:EAL domain-containing protein (putative c-di-GMP-specific phosphodiesterase class I)